MVEISRLYVKKPNVKRSNSSIRIHRENSFQPLKSPYDRILFLQRTIGNQAVLHLIQSGIRQAKLRVGQPNDIYEEEADRIVEQVMSMPETKMRRPEEEEGEETVRVKPIAELITPLVQRQGEEKEEEPVQAWIQRQPEDENEEKEKLIHNKESTGLNPGIGPDLELKIRSLKGGGRPLPKTSCEFFESRFGYDFDQVRVHTDSEAGKLVKVVNAQAFTVGQDIAFGEGYCSPETVSGRKLLAHELTHVVQQSPLIGESREVKPRTPLPLSSTILDLQMGPPLTEAGRFAQRQAVEDLSYLRTTVVDALRATGVTINVNTADAIRDGILTLGVITLHPEPAQHAMNVNPAGTYYFPDTDLNRVFQSHVDTVGTANVPGSPANRIYLLVRRHFSLPRFPSSTFFRGIVHEGQHYLDHHTGEVRSRSIPRDIFNLWLSYKTEFNAYWVDGGYDFYPTSREGLSSTGPRILRWEAIRHFLMFNRPYSSRFRWLWCDSMPPQPSSTGEAHRIASWRSRMYPRYHNWFQRRIDSYHEPEAFNRLNSPRIERFYRAIRNRPISPAEVRASLVNLDARDLSEIRGSTRFQELVNACLRRDSRLRAEVRGRIWPNISP